MNARVEGRTGEQDPRELRDAAERLERAVQDLARSASTSLNQQATRLIGDLERSARRLGAQLDGDAAGPERRESSASARTEAPRPLAPSPRASRANGWLRDLYRDPEHRMIAGVCAGIARAYGVERWVVRLVAVTLLLFMPQIAFFGYLAGIFLLAKRPALAPAPAWDGRGSDAPEFGGRLAPRPALRTLRLRFRDLEVRLRRLEGYVTSREFDLDREFVRLERD
ncbi:MAG: PspC domain-containing protein [Pseudomonadales bacterium]|nr:PspC domain-containing protein [Pseudomonadales bacterium]